jgi:hypothetical protein
VSIVPFVVPLVLLGLLPFRDLLDSSENIPLFPGQPVTRPGSFLFPTGVFRVVVVRRILLFPAVLPLAPPRVI